jgi:PPM family protein phosphatase
MSNSAGNSLTGIGGLDMPSHCDSPQPAAEHGFQIESCGYSTCGSGRRGNEDCFLIDPDNRFFVVADGGVSSGCGEVASSMACELIRPQLSQIVSASSPSEAIYVQIDSALRHTHRMIVRRQLQDLRSRNMATSVVAAVVDQHKLHLATIGDSRAILIRSGRATPLTRDHTLATGMMDAGYLTAESARNHPWRDVVYNVLGGKGCVGCADQSQTTLVSGDRLILATDGVTDVIPRDRMAFVVEQYFHPKHAARALIDLASTNGGCDDRTCIVVFISASTW